MFILILYNILGQWTRLIWNTKYTVNTLLPSCFIQKLMPITDSHAHACLKTNKLVDGKQRSGSKNWIYKYSANNVLSPYSDLWQENMPRFLYIVEKDKRSHQNESNDTIFILKLIARYNYLKNGLIVFSTCAT